MLNWQKKFEKSKKMGSLQEIKKQAKRTILSYFSVLDRKMSGNSGSVKEKLNSCYSYMNDPSKIRKILVIT